VPLGSSRPQRVEADLLYFANERRNLDHSEPLVLVECKRLIKDDKDLKTAAGQVRGMRCGSCQPITRSLTPKR
jgi:hypothetical protein